MRMTLPPGSNTGLPPVDAPLVAEDCGYEIVDGRLVAVPPAHEPHGERHSKLLALLEAHVTADFNVACDMLTRTSETTNIAPDASVYPMARDPDTGRRQLEVLAFEVLDAQSLSDAADRARRLARRGVRRVFAVDVVHQRVFEWSAGLDDRLDDWRVMADAAVIDDEAFAAPLPVAALVHASKSDDAVAAALLAKGNRVLREAHEDARSRGLQRGLEQGLERGLAQGLDAARITLLAIFESRGLHPTASERDRICACRDLAVLGRWAVRAATAASVADALSS